MTKHPAGPTQGEGKTLPRNDKIRPDAESTPPPGEDRLHQALKRLRTFPHASRRIQILETLQQRCSLEDLRNLCFYLGLDYDMLPGDRKMAKARSLIDHYDRRDDLHLLTTQLLRIRPDLEGNL
jgi:hypothetical protein